MTSHKWHIEWHREVEKDLSKLSSQNRMRVFDSIAELAKSDDPGRVHGVKSIESKHGLFRQRQGDYRIIFSFDSGEVVELDFTYKGTLAIHTIKIHHTGY